MSAGSWRCPICKTLADDARAHLVEAHGVGGGQDRFGLRDATRKRPTPPGGLPPSDDDRRDDGDRRDGDGPGVGPPVWRRASRPRPRRAPGTGSDGDGRLGGPEIGWRTVRRPARRIGTPPEPPEMAPARPEPLPPEAAVLRLVCDHLDGVDVSALQGRLLDLPGVESVTIDLYDRTVDLFIDRRRTTARPLVALIASRLRLPIRVAEIHRAAAPGQKLGDETRLFVVQ